MKRPTIRPVSHLTMVFALAGALAAFPARALAADAAPGHHAAHSEAMPGHSHEKCERHGGDVAMTKDHHFETVWKPDGLRIYVYTEAQAPASLGKAAGKVTFRMADGSSKGVVLVAEKPAEGESPTVYFCPMHPDVVQMKPGICTKCGTMKLVTQDRLFASIDLTGAKPGSVKGFVALNGLKGREKEASFVSTFTEMAPKPATDEHTGPAHEHGTDEGAEHSHH